VHQHCIDGEPVQPGTEGRVSAKRFEFAMHLKKGLLGEIFSQREIVHNSNADCENSLLVLSVKL
jgi:hypothetical protein